MKKLIVVTGGSKGIGRAILQRFAKEGFDIATCSRNKNDLQSLKKKIEFEHKCNAYVFQADMAKIGEVNKFAKFIEGLKRPIDVLVNNAGYFVPGEICKEPDGTLESMIDSNLYSAYNMTRALIGKMKKRKAGHIINMCSVASIKAYPNGGSYGIAKFALLGFSKVLREELKPFGVRVTAVMPGATRTASWASSDLPEDRFMKSEDIADLIYATHSLSLRSVVEEIIIRPQLGDI